MNQKQEKILIVEDEESILKALVEKFQDEGYEVYSAKDGKSGFSLAKKEKPDLVLLDIVMPIMDGAEMLKKMRQEEWGQDLKVVILTNLNEKDEIFNLLESDVQGYLIKANWKLADVAKKVASVLAS